MFSLFLSCNFVVIILFIFHVSVDVSAMTVVLNGTTVNVEGSYLHVPRLNYTEKMQYSDEHCLRNYTVSQFRCLLRDSSYDTFNSSDFRMQVLIVAFGALTVESGVVIDAPTIEGIYCSQRNLSICPYLIFPASMFQFARKRLLLFMPARNSPHQDAVVLITQGEGQVNLHSHQRQSEEAEVEGLEVMVGTALCPQWEGVVILG